MNNPAKQADLDCPACGEGTLQPQAELETVEYRGQAGELELHYAVCDACGADLTGADDSRCNKRAMNAFKKSVDGLLSGREIRAFRKRLGLNQKLAAQLLGGGPIAFSRYERDDIVQSAAMDTALRLCKASPSNLLTLAQVKKMELPSDLVERITRNEKDQLIFMIRAIREQLDREQTIVRPQPASRTKPAVESVYGLSLRWRKTRHWGSA